MTEPDATRTSHLPSRRELRLARFAAEQEARRIEEQKRAERAARLAEMLERSKGQERVTSRRSLHAVTEDPAAAIGAQSESVVVVVETEPTTEAEAAATTQPIAVVPKPEALEPEAETAEPARRSSRRKIFVRVAAGVAAVAAGVGVTSGVIALRTASPAQASVALSDSILNTLQIPSASPDTPDSLKARSGAAEAWRMSEIERYYAKAEPGEKCNAMSGASSLASAFYDQSDSVILPLALGDYELTSNFGHRFDPFTGNESTHLGQDFGAPLDTPIYAAADGTVLHAGLGLDGRSNNLIIIQHEIDGEKFTTWYVHMYDDGVFVEAGDEVKVGDTIGLVGSNGRSTGPHLHFEVHQGEGIEDTEVVNPLDFLNSIGARDVADLCF